jgi:beta-glucosidase
MTPAPTIGNSASKSSPGTGFAMEFPRGFLWGVSTAAHQVEGENQDNQWYDWEAAGRIRSGERCGLACDWWNNAERDFDLARDMGLNALRLSVEWSRLEPQPGQWNGQAWQRYRQMLEGLQQRGIQPIVCLHHFTHPKWFERQGGFLGKNAGEIFARFARRVVLELGDLCRYWVTFNEPNVFAALGYVLGEFPPGRKGKIGTSLRLVNAMAQCHAQVYRSIHELQNHALVGWAHNYVVFEPANPSFAPDRWIAGLLSYLFNESFLAVVEKGRPALPFHLTNGGFRNVKGSCDFVGLNVYSRFHVAFSLRHRSQLFGNVFVPEHVPQGDSGVEKPYGEAFPGAIRAAVRRAARLGKPIYILENGVPDAEDRIRPWLIVNVVQDLHRLLGEGHDIRGYFHWTLTDNFEWSEGWKLKFGLVALDPSTQRRTVRTSGRLYGAIARANGISSDAIEQFSSARPQKQQPA